MGRTKGACPLERNPYSPSIQAANRNDRHLHCLQWVLCSPRQKRTGWFHGRSAQCGLLFESLCLFPRRLLRREMKLELVECLTLQRKAREQMGRNGQRKKGALDDRGPQRSSIASNGVVQLTLRQQVIRQPLWQPDNNRIASYTADNQSKDCKLG